jgi:hypothetical protein
VPKIKENQKLESISNSKTIIFVAQEKKTAFTYMVYVITIPEHRKHGTVWYRPWKINSCRLPLINSNSVL